MLAVNQQLSSVSFYMWNKLSTEYAKYARLTGHVWWKFQMSAEGVNSRWTFRSARKNWAKCPGKKFSLSPGMKCLAKSQNVRRGTHSLPDKMSGEAQKHFAYSVSRPLISECEAVGQSGNGHIPGKPCQFPFTIEGQVHYGCTFNNAEFPWCYTGKIMLWSG